MSEWRDATLGDVADLLVGFAFKSADFTANPTDARLLRGVNIGQGTLDWDRTGYWPVNDAPSSKYLLEDGDVVLAMDRPWIEAGLKRARLRPEDLPALLVQRVTRLRGTPHARTSFIHHLIASETFSRYIQAIVTGATVPHISQSQIAAFRFLVPPVREQEQICEVLDALDNLIESNRRRVELLEQMAQAIYREWFVRFRYPGHEDATFVDSPLGPIPEGWRAGSVGDLVELRKTTVDPGDVAAGTPAVGLEHIPRKRLTLDTWGTAEGLASRKSTFEHGDVLFGKIRPYFHKVAVAPMNGICSTDCMVFAPVDNYRSFATLSLFEEEFVTHVANSANGTKMPRASWEVMRDYEMPIPPAGLSSVFDDMTQPWLEAAEKLMLASREIACIRDLLLPKLVTGQIDVSDLDLDELVERVA